MDYGRIVGGLRDNCGWITVELMIDFWKIVDELWKANYRPNVRRPSIFLSSCLSEYDRVL